LVTNKELLGIGGFGAVFKIYDALSNRQMACKEVDLGMVNITENQKVLAAIAYVGEIPLY